MRMTQARISYESSSSDFSSFLSTNSLPVYQSRRPSGSWNSEVGSSPCSRNRRTMRCTKTITGTERMPLPAFSPASALASKKRHCLTSHVFPVPGPSRQSTSCAMSEPCGLRGEGSRKLVTSWGTSCTLMYSGVLHPSKMLAAVMKMSCSAMSSWLPVIASSTLSSVVVSHLQ